MFARPTPPGAPARRPEFPRVRGLRGAPPASPGRATAALLMALGRALHRFGAPSHRLEEALTRAAARLGHTGEFFATPTALFGAFGDGAAVSPDWAPPAPFTVRLHTT